MTRRDAAWLITRAAAVAGGSEFFAGWMRAAQMAHDHSSAPPDPHNWSDYKPQFFSAAQFQTLDVFTSILIPTDETPGARQAYVTPFIDFVINAAAEYAPEMQSRWRDATRWLDSQNFGNLTSEAQVALMEQMSEPEQDPSKTHPGYPTYRLIKEMTIHAFYTSRVGLIDVLQYKGLAYLTEFPACKHPEHQQV